MALGYLSFNPTAARMIIGAFRDEPELYTIFREYVDLLVVARQFRDGWSNTERDGLPALR